MKLTLTILILIITTLGFSQTQELNNKKVWFITSSVGVQMSGIKPEDFIVSNYSPAFSFNIGVWFTPEIALQMGYKGFYFNAIADNDKHYYNYTYGAVIIDITEMFDRANDKRKWNLLIHPGAGFFNNMYYGRPNVCLNIGMINSLDISNHISLYVEVSAIAGWDIYQGNDDILPSITMGANYSFR